MRRRSNRAKEEKIEREEWKRGMKERNENKREKKRRKQ